MKLAMAGSQDFAADPRNATSVVWLNGELVPRAQAKVSLFDAGFGMGDGVWEGLRLHKGALLFLDDHLDRLFAGARAIDLDIGKSRGEIAAALSELLAANAMEDGVHLRLMITRGVKSTISQDPRNALGAPTIAITAEYKKPAHGRRGLALATVSTRCTPPSMFDMRLNSHSRLNLIMALNEAIAAGADEALMLDPDGAIASCNATNFFFVAGGRLRTSTGEFCFNGVTRGKVIALCHAHGLPLELGAFPPEAARGADEAFVTGTMGGITPVRRIDGRDLADSPGPVTLRLAELYAELIDGEAGP